MFDPHGVVQVEADLEAKYALEMELRVQLDTTAAERAALAQEIQEARAQMEREAEARSKVEAELAEQREREVQLRQQLERASVERSAFEQTEAEARARMEQQLEQQRQAEAAVRLRLAAAEQVGCAVGIALRWPLIDALARVTEAHGL